MAELVDALDLGSSALACMGVQLPPLAPEKTDVDNLSFICITGNDSEYLIKFIRKRKVLDAGYC